MGSNYDLSGFRSVYYSLISRINVGRNLSTEIQNRGVDNGSEK